MDHSANLLNQSLKDRTLLDASPEHDVQYDAFPIIRSPPNPQEGTMAATLEAQNWARSPAVRLLPELLAEIFELACLLPDFPSLSTDPAAFCLRTYLYQMTQTRNVIMSICYRWSLVARNMTRLWTTMYLRDRPRGKIPLSLAMSSSLTRGAFDLTSGRAKHRPLRIVVERSDPSPITNNAWRSMGEHITANIDRIELLSLQVIRGSVNDWPILRGQRLALPKLRRLVVGVWTMEDLKLDLSLAPLLEELWISAFPNCISLINAPAVKKLGLTKAKSLEKAIETIKACPNLETLTWDYSSAIPDPIAGSPFAELRLMHMKHIRLAINSISLHQLLSLEAPVLERLCLQMLDTHFITLDLSSHFPLIRELAIVTKENATILLPNNFLETHPQLRVVETYGGSLVPWWLGSSVLTNFNPPRLLPHLETVRSKFKDAQVVEWLIQHYAWFKRSLVVEMDDRALFERLHSKFGDWVSFDSGESFSRSYWRDWIDSPQVWQDVA